MNGGAAEIRTDRLVLRPMDPVVATAILAGEPRSDWAAGFPQQGDVVVAGWVVQGAATDGVAEVDPGWGAWEVRTAEGELIGTAGFHGPPHDGEVELGYGIASGHRGRGLATEAAGALLTWARRAGARRAVARVLPGNEPSVGVLRHLGFVPADAEPAPSGEVLMARALHPAGPAPA